MFYCIYEDPDEENFLKPVTHLGFLIRKEFLDLFIKPIKGENLPAKFKCETKEDIKNLY